MPEGRQRVERGSHFEKYAPAAPSITTIRSTARYIFFSVEMDHAIPALAGFHFNFCLVDEHSISNQP
jgi:hypothetical protein